MFTKVYLPDLKEQTCNLAPEPVDLPDEVVIPLRQNIGATCEPLVAVGETVLAGQKIGESKSFCSAIVHSSISGQVTDISEKMTSFGSLISSVTIKSDGADRWEKADGIKDFEKSPVDELIAKIRQAGIVGMGGAMFPTHIKLCPPKEKKIDTLIVNAAECEPYITTDHALMLAHAAEIVSGLKIVKKILDVNRVYLAIEQDKWDAIELLRQKTGKEDIRVVDLDTNYPQGAEKTLIKTLINKEVPSGCLPMDVGVVVQNVGTVKAIYDAVVNSKPLIERIITVTGSGVANPKNLLVRVGTPFSKIIQFCGGYAGNVSKIISGGPMMGITQINDSVCAIKGTTGILVLQDKDVKVEEEIACIRCSECIRVCPARLMPNMIASFSAHNRFDDALEYGVLDCVECGNCAYVCPSKIRHVHWIKLAKVQISAKNSKEKK